MSWYRIVLTTILCTSTLFAKVPQELSDDVLIIEGLFYEEYKAYDLAWQHYIRLYERTHAPIYLFKASADALVSNSHIQESIERLTMWQQNHPETSEVHRLLIPLYLSIGETTAAKQEAIALIAHSSSAKDLKLASNPYLYTGEFEKALALLQKVYAKEHEEEVLLKIVDIMEHYTHQSQEARQLLESHRRMYGASRALYVKLLWFYTKEKDIDGMLDIYKALYAQEPKPAILQKIIDGYLYKGDLSGAVAFMEEMKIRSGKLLELYKATHAYAKARALLTQLYSESHNPKWLAEEAILTFEGAKDKHDPKMLHRVVDGFEKALAQGVDDSLYLNYYGYTLIDNDIDIKKGIAILQEALKQQPYNTYYLDSIAWGYYKEGACKRAYSIMEGVVAQEGLDVPEIATHWAKIKACKK